MPQTKHSCLQSDNCCKRTHQPMITPLNTLDERRETQHVAQVEAMNLTSIRPFCGHTFCRSCCSDPSRGVNLMSFDAMLRG